MWVFFILIIFLIIIISSTVKIKIDEKLLDSYKKIRDLNYIISINLFNKIKIISFKITNDKIGKSNRIIKSGYKEVFKVLRRIFKTRIIKLEKLNINLKLGTEDVEITSYIVTSISVILSQFLAKQIDNFSNENYRYQIVPLYINKNALKLSINCIASIKLVHIIYMIYVLKRKDDENNGRTSNRRSYDNSNEQHKRYGRCKYNYR